MGDLIDINLEPSKDEADMDWTISPKFLDALSEKNELGERLIAHSQIEAVLEAVGFPTLLKIAVEAKKLSYNKDHRWHCREIIKLIGEVEERIGL
jgi:hypothetical protein